MFFSVHCRFNVLLIAGRHTVVVFTVMSNCSEKSLMKMPKEYLGSMISKEFQIDKINWVISQSECRFQPRG
jgi:hypothetical protein